VPDINVIGDESGELDEEDNDIEGVCGGASDTWGACGA